MEFKDWNLNYKRWPLIISRVIRIASILIKNPNPSQKFSWILFGILNDENSNPPSEMRIFSIYIAALKWTYPYFGTPGSALGFWKLDILYENPEILIDF